MCRKKKIVRRGARCRHRHERVFWFFPVVKHTRAIDEEREREREEERETSERERYKEERDEHETPTPAQAGKKQRSLTALGGRRHIRRCV
jgi:hypothetical protein